MRVDCSRSRFDARLQGRWVDGLASVSGIFRGTVESYTVLDAEASYALGRSWIVGGVLGGNSDQSGSLCMIAPIDSVAVSP